MYAVLSCSGVSVAPSNKYLPLCLLLIVKVVVFQLGFAVQASLVTRQTCRRPRLLPVSQPATGGRKKKNSSKSESGWWSMCMSVNISMCVCAECITRQLQQLMSEGLLTIAGCKLELLSTMEMKMSKFNRSSVSFGTVLRFKKKESKKRKRIKVKLKLQ